MSAELAIAVLVAGCSGGAGGEDSGRADAGAVDAGDPRAEDAAAPDAGPLDSRDGGPDHDAGPRDAATSDAGPRCPTPTAPRGMWVWQREVVTDPAARDALFEFALDKGVTAVFVEAQSLVGDDPEGLAAFVDAAADRCVAVDLLFGDAAWAETDEHARVIDLARGAIAVARLTTTPPRGVHLDVEPHVLDRWDRDPGGLGAELVTLFRAVAGTLDGSGLQLSVDIPFWYDGVDVVDAGEARPLSELVQDAVDRTVLMDYRDHAAPPDGIVDHAEDELAYGAVIGRPVVVAVETLCGLEPEKVTFCEEGEAAMEAELAAAAAAFDDEPAFDGFAVHDHRAYAALGP